MIRSARKTQLAQQLMENLSQAQSDIMEKEDQIGEISKVAFRDALTGVCSKAAYDQLSDELLPELSSGKTAVSVVMADVNDLKYINDSFGHDKGDVYLCGCCRVICNAYKHSPVFRLGGDEFAVVLRGSDYDNRAALTAQLVRALEQSRVREDVPAWERYSAAVGMADCESGDTALEQVLKRADAAMYAAKQAFKAEHGSYR